MAIWQLCFNAVEKNKNLDDKDICLWTKEPNDVYNISFLCKAKSWSSEIIQFGNIDETCIELISEQNKVVEISVRLDLRTLDKKQLYSLIGYIDKIDANIFYQGNLYTPSITSFTEMIQNSSALKFCRDPFLFLENISVSLSNNTGK